MPISPTLPTAGSSDWDEPLNAALTEIIDAVNDQETELGNKLDTSAAAELIRDTIAAALLEGTNVTITVDDAGDTITIAAAGGGGGLDAEAVRDTIGTALVEGSGVDITVNDAGDTITIAVVDASATAKGIVELATDAETITGTDTARAVTPASLAAKLADTSVAEIIRDVIGAALAEGAAIDITVNDGGDSITIAATDASATAKGIVELATDAEAITGTDTVRAITPANLAAVLAAVRGAYVGINAQTGTTYTPVLGDQGKLVTLTNAASITVTLPQNSSLAFPIGASIDFLILGAGQATFSAGSGATKVPSGTITSRQTGAFVTVVKIATNEWAVGGDTA